MSLGVEGFSAFVSFLDSSGESSSREYESAQAAIEGHRNLKKQDAKYINLTLTIGVIMERKAGGCVLASELEKLVESEMLKPSWFSVSLRIKHEVNFDEEAAVDVMKVINRSIKNGTKFSELEIEHKAEDGMTEKEVEFLVNGIDKQHKENLPYLSFYIYSSAGIAFLEFCTKLKWPIYLISISLRKNGRILEYNWEKIKSLLKHSTFRIDFFGIDIQNEFPLKPLMDALAETEEEIRIFNPVGCEVELLENILGLPRFRGEQIKSLEVFSSLSDIMWITRSTCILSLPYHPTNFVNFARKLSQRYDLRYMDLDKIEIDISFGLRPLTYEYCKEDVLRLMETISSKPHHIISFNVTFALDEVKITEKLKNQVKANLTNKIATWIRSGTKVNYSRRKIMLIGKGQAGKSSTLQSLLGKAFNENIKSTSVVDANKDVSIEVQHVSSSSWEEAHSNKGNWMSKEMGEYLLKLENNVDLAKHQDEVSDQLPIKQSETRSIPSKENFMVVEKFEKADVAKEVSQQLTSNTSIVAKTDDNNLGTKDIGRLTIWDFGGQDVFYAIHHLYLTTDGLYLLVFDLNLMNQQIEKEMKFIEFWLHSVSTHAPGASVIMIGTRCNDVLEEDQKSIDVQLRTATKRQHVKIWQNEELIFFPIDNSDEDSIESRLKPLKNKILGWVNRIDLPEEERSKQIPLSWMFFMNHLVSNFKAVITTNQLFEISREMNLNWKKEILPMIEFYKNAGAIIPFMRTGGNSLDHIVLSPQWLLEVLKTFIYDPDLHQTNRHLYEKSETRDLIMNYETTGIASKSLLLEMLKASSTVPQKDLEFLLDLGQEMLLISRFDFQPQWVKTEGDVFYLVPSMNKQVSDEETITEDAAIEDCINIYLHFEKFIPMGLFERVVCLMMNCNQDFDGATLEPTLCRNFAMFCFREVEVFLIPETENRDFRIAIQKENGEDLNLIPNLLKIGSLVQERLKSDVLGKEIESSIQIQCLDSKGNAIRCFVQDLINAVSKKKTKMKVLMANGRQRLKNISLFGEFTEAAAAFVEQEEENIMLLDQEKKLEWEHDCFLAHTWGPNNETHEAVLEIGEMLKARGMRIWVDAANLKQYISSDIIRGLRKSSCILIFITELYFQKVQNKDTNAAREFISATRKGCKYLLPVVLDPNCLDPKSWFGSTAAYNLQDGLYIDFSSKEKIIENMDALICAINQMGQRQRPANSFDTVV